ncbi:GAF domain-containing protein [Cellulomonas fengjieae]|uniref:GAF domain-containing protein n=1 Tax=Cellulomonas fengjieae TaxID=2819978 RepID=A0ABS3SKH0_9CELL|nr:GAF domain-containing protein [Cellulomonas fengjieae]MBO3086162.1 GAF domain-containing protein [Cellulomonas fengjieae]QVI65779.1 GAF domain-containing protein [Cellulomonas fengjieae]
MSETVDAARVRAAHELFVTTGQVPSRAVRTLVAESWRRSRRSGVDPDVQNAPVDMSGNALSGYRRALALAAAMPVIRELLVRPGADAGWVTALTDDVGRMLWVEGDPQVRSRVEGVGFVEGAVWREDCAGTNALGTALTTNRPVQVVGSEHYAVKIHPWSCSAVPVHAPSGQVLGVLDVTGGPMVASGLVMSLVRATVAAVEAELARAAAAPTEQHPVVVLGGTATARLRVLGAPTLHLGGATVRLSLRHAELLLLLSRHPAGLSADELAVLLSEHELSDVTVRAEVSRLRRLVGPLLSESRPYRLTAPLRTDVDMVHAMLDTGDVDAALTAYCAPVLARSVAPGVERIRDELAADVRGAVLASPLPEVVSRWLASDAGAEDWQAWERLAWLAPKGSPVHVRAVGRLDLLGRRLGAPPRA